MRRIVYSAMFSAIVVAGLFVWMVKGPEVRHKWISKMKNKHEQKRMMKGLKVSEVALDDFEMSAFHS